jgi:CP12 domain
MKKNIKEHCDSIVLELNSNCSRQRRRHLESELEMLTKYMANHPDAEETPSSLELYCDLNPSALECRIYEE